MVVGAGVLMAGSGTAEAGSTAGSPKAGFARPKLTANGIAAKDGTVLYYKDWGNGPVVVFCHGYPLSSDSWENQSRALSHSPRIAPRHPGKADKAARPPSSHPPQNRCVFTPTQLSDAILTQTDDDRNAEF